MLTEKLYDGFAVSYFARVPDSEKISFSTVNQLTPRLLCVAQQVAGFSLLHL